MNTTDQLSRESATPADLIAAGTPPAGFFDDNDVEVPVASFLLVPDGRRQMLAVSDRRCRAFEL